MHPIVELNGAIVASNARAWKIFAGTDLYAVVKADAYGWGLDAVLPSLEETAVRYCVSDAAELRRLRKRSSKPAIVLGTVADGELEEVLRADALPTIENVRQLEAAERTFSAMKRPLRVRVGVRPAASWSGSELDAIAALAPLLARRGALVELWTHVTGSESEGEQIARLQYAERILRDAGAQIDGIDACGTSALAAGCRAGTSVRIGAGLFGSGAAAVPGVACAISVRAPVVRCEEFPAGTRVGYGGTMLGMNERIVTARCGYADGLPNSPAFADDILSVGMQYVTARSPESPPKEIPILESSTNLDDFAARCGRLPHDVIAALGNGARARSAV